MLQAAGVEFCSRGYRATTTEAIARQAGLTKGALYFHFKSKEAIFCELMKRAIDRFAAAFEPGAGRGLDPGDVMRLLLQIDTGRSEPRTRHNLDLWAEVLKLPRIKIHVDRAVRKTIELVANRLDASYGADIRQRRQVAIMTFALYDGLTLTKQLSPDFIDMDHQIRLFASLFERNLRRGASEHARARAAR